MFERYTSKLLLSPKTKIGDYVFDVYTSINHSMTATVTNHPVQFGASISDHKYDEPDQLVFQIGMSDASQDLFAGQFSNTRRNISEMFNGLKNSASFYGAGWNDLSKSSLKYAKKKAFDIVSESRSVNAFNRLAELKVLGMPLTCVTRLHTYNNMIITSITTDDTNETKYGLRATVTLREIISPELQKVQVNSTVMPHAQITQTTDTGAKNVFDFSLNGDYRNVSTDYVEFVEKGGGQQI